MQHQQSKLGWILVVVAVAGAAAATVGCGDDDGMMTPTDAGVMGTDAGEVMLPSVKRGPTAAAGCLPDAMGLPTCTASVYTNRGTNTVPTPGAAIDYTFTVKDFQTDDTVAGVMVQLFTNNVVADTCVAPDCLLGMSDAMGSFMAHGPANAWYAYRMLPKMGPTAAATVVGSVQYNEPAPAMSGSTVEGNSVSRATLNLIPTVLGFRQQMGTAIIAGAVRDSENQEVFGAVIRAYGSDGMLIVEGEAMASPHIRYFNGDSFPSPTAMFTDVDGLYAVANIPPDRSPIRLEAWGRLTDADMTPVILGCETARIFGDTVTIINIVPLRSDGPADCPRM